MESSRTRLVATAKRFWYLLFALFALSLLLQAEWLRGQETEEVTGYLPIIQHQAMFGGFPQVES